MKPIELCPLALGGPDADEALVVIRRVLERGSFVLGPEVEAFEVELAQAGGTEAAVGVGSGTDALLLGLLALGIGPGDEVIVPAFTAFPTVAAVLGTGATPVLVDVQPDRPIPPLDQVEAAVTGRTRAAILVHLYGTVGDAPAWVDALAHQGVAVVEDCAQAQGAVLPDGRPVGAAGTFGSFSFYPTKNLAAIGDGGAVVTSDRALAAEVRAWRSHGERAARYRHELPARNSRLDDVQAAVLRLRLRRLAGAVDRRRRISTRYAEAFDRRVTYVSHGPSGAPHLAVVRVPDPGGLAAHLADRGIATGRHYPLALTAQPALAHLPAVPVPHAEAFAASCLSLPVHPGLDDGDIERVVAGVVEWSTSRPTEGQKA